MTAVEWMVKQLNINGTVIPMEIESKAKEMENEQSLKMPTYNLKELADEYANVDGDYDEHYGHVGFKAGFQKALELLTYKSE